MKVIEVPYENLADYHQDAVDDGYNWGCTCGESYKSKEAAENCKNCKKYVIDTPTEVYYTPSKED